MNATDTIENQVVSAVVPLTAQEQKAIDLCKALFATIENPFADVTPAAIFRAKAAFLECADPVRELFGEDGTAVSTPGFFNAFIEAIPVPLRPFVVIGTVMSFGQVIEGR